MGSLVWPGNVHSRHSLGQSKIRDVWLPVAIDKNVGRLQVAVQHTALMSQVNGATNGSKNLSRLGRRHWTASQSPRQSRPIHPLHCEVGTSFEFAHGVYRHDIRQIEPTGRLGL